MTEEQQVILKIHRTIEGSRWCVEIYNKLPGCKPVCTGRRFSIMRPEVQWEP